MPCFHPPHRHAGCDPDEIEEERGCHSDEPGVDRRGLLLGATGAVLAAGLAGNAAAALARPTHGVRRGRTTVTLLGVQGGPGGEPGTDRPGAFGTSHLLTVGGRPYLIDAGKGALMQLQRIRLAPDKLTGRGGAGHVFVTHLHSDHIFDLGNVLYMKWEAAVFLNEPVTMNVYGPAPLSRLVDATFAYFHPDVTYRADGDDQLLWRRSHVKDHNFTHAQIASGVPFKVFEDDRVKVHAVGVVHPPVPTVAYRFDTDDLSITFSADTAPTPSLLRLAKGSDILIHEAFHKQTVERLFPGDASFNFADYMGTVHTSADDVGQVATDAGVKKLVLNHLYPSSHRLVPPAAWRKAVRRHYDGPVVIGHELAVVD